MREYWICEEGLDPCGHIFTNSAGVEELHESDLPIPALGHNWQEPTYEWDIDNTTCTAKRVCANDETEVETEKVATTPTVEKESTCTEGGKVSYAAHFTNPAFVDQIKIVHTAEKGHTAGKAVVENANQPSCVLAGSHDIVTYCATCSAEMDRRTLYDAPLGHDWGDWSKVDAQSTDTHIVEKRTCKRVGCGYEEVREIDGEEGHAHTWALVKKVDPTCTTEGEEIWKCTGAGCGATKSQSIATIPHKFGNSSYVNIIDPGCTSYGYSIYLDHCAMCNKIFDGHLVTDPPLSHDWSEWHVKKPATETESGEQERICNNNHAHVETLIINPIGHTWTDWAVVTPPTTTSEGLEKRTCTGCGAEETRTLPALFVYTLNFAEKGTWKKGTETPLILNLKRSFKNQETYDLFSEISVDKQWVPAISIEGVTYFTIRKGHSFVDDSSDTSQGLELIMMPDYLETLSTGNHSVIVRFVDGLTIGLFAVQSADPSEDPEGDTPDPEKHGEGKGGSSKDPVDPVDPIDPDFPEGDTETNGSRGKAGADDDPSDPADNDNKHTGSNKDKKNSSTEESDEETPYGDNKKIAASESDQMPKTADGLSIMPCALVSLLSLCVAMKVRFRRDRLANRLGSKNLK